MKKRVIILTFLISIFSSVQIFAFGVKADGIFGGKTSLCDLGVVFNNEKRTNLFSTGLTFGSVKYTATEEVRVSNWSYEEKDVDKSAAVFGAFFDWTHRFPIFKKTRFDVGLDCGTGIRLVGGSGFIMDLYPKLGISAQAFGAVLDLNYQFIFRVQAMDSVSTLVAYDNAFTISCTYLFGKKKGRTMSDQTEVPSEESPDYNYIIVDPEVTF